VLPTPSECLAALSEVTEDARTWETLLAWKDNARRDGCAGEGECFEAALLRAAGAITAARIETLPVHDSVKTLLRQEFEFYSNPPARFAATLAIGRYEFVAASKIVTLRRFPAGPLDWEVSGLPRSTLFEMHPAPMCKTLWFVLTKMHGFAPAFFVHVARRPKNRSLVIEKEVLGAYYRMARSLELQPSMKGIVTMSWFHDPEAVRDNPHLEPINRPYRHFGGVIVVAGSAPATAGFMEHNIQRQKRYQQNQLHYRIGVALWPRKAAIAWAKSHSEFGEEVALCN
jgi:hypothetical protein